MFTHNPQKLQLPLFQCRTLIQQLNGSYMHHPLSPEHPEGGRMSSEIKTRVSTAQHLAAVKPTFVFVCSAAVKFDKYFFYLGFFSDVPRERHGVVGNFLHVADRAEAFLVVGCAQTEKTDWVSSVSVGEHSNEIQGKALQHRHSLNTVWLGGLVDIWYLTEGLALFTLLHTFVFIFLWE